VSSRRSCRKDNVAFVDEVVLSLYAKGLTTEEISAHGQQGRGQVEVFPGQTKVPQSTSCSHAALTIRAASSAVGGSGLDAAAADA
jgi:hypothetical protein